MGSPFFVAGGTVSAEAPSYIVRAADHQLVDALRANEFTSILDSRQKGKSSLMARAIAQLRQDGARCVRIDLQRYGSNLDAERWYAGLLNAVGQDLGLTGPLFAYWGAHQNLGPLQRWCSALETIALPSSPSPLLVFLDEIDFLRSLPFNTDEFLAGLRELYNRRGDAPNLRRLAFCLIGVATPSDLIRDPRVTPFNVGRRISLDDFTVDEVLTLAPGLADRPNSAGILRRITHWTGGHPYLTQLVAAQVASSPALQSPHQVDRLITDLFLAEGTRDQEPNLRDVARRILEATPAGLEATAYRCAVLDLYARARLRRQGPVFDETDPVANALRLSGVVRTDQGRLTPRNRIYRTVFNRDWIAAHMPDAELQRQRAAARRAVRRISFASAAVILALGGFATSSVVSLREAETQRALALKNLNAARTAEREAQRQANVAERARDAATAAQRTLNQANQALNATNQRLTKAQLEAATNLQIARENARRAEVQRRVADANARLARNSERRATAAADDANRLLYATRVAGVLGAVADGNPRLARQLIASARAMPGEFHGPDLGYWEARLQTGNLLPSAVAQPPEWAGAGRYLVALEPGPTGPTLRLRDAASTRVLAETPLEGTGRISVDPTGQTVAIAHTAPDPARPVAHLRLFRVPTLTLLTHVRWSPRARIGRPVWNADGSRLLVRLDRRDAALLERTEGRWTARPPVTLLEANDGVSEAFRLLASVPSGASAADLGGLSESSLVVAPSSDSVLVVRLENDGRHLLVEPVLSLTGTSPAPARQRLLTDERPQDADLGVLLGACVSPDGSRLYATFSRQVLGWRLEGGQLLFRPRRLTPAESPTAAAAITPDGLRLLVPTAAGLREWDAWTGIERDLRIAADLSGVSRDPEGRYLTAVAESEVHHWDRFQLATPPVSGSGSEVLTTADTAGPWVIGVGNRIQLDAREPRRRITTIPFETDSPTRPVADARATTWASVTPDRRIAVTRPGQPRTVINPGGDPVLLALSPDGRTLGGVRDDGRWFAYRLDSRTPRALPGAAPGPDVQSLVVDLTGTFHAVVAGSQGVNLVRWQPGNPARAQLLRRGGRGAPLLTSTVAVSSQGDWIAVTEPDNGALQLFARGSHQPILVDAHVVPVSSLAFTGSGGHRTRLATVDRFGELRLWQLSGNQPLMVLRVPWGANASGLGDCRLALSPDGTWAAVQRAGRVAIVPFSRDLARRFPPEAAADRIARGLTEARQRPDSAAFDYYAQRVTPELWEVRDVRNQLLEAARSPEVGLQAATLRAGERIPAAGLALADALAERGDWAQASVFIQRGLTEADSPLLALRRKALLHARLGQRDAYAEALRELGTRAAASPSPNDWADTVLTFGLLDNAPPLPADLFQRSITFLENPRTAWLAGLAQLRAGDVTQARRTLAFPTAWRSPLGTLGLAECAAREGRRSDALGLLRLARALQLRSPSPRWVDTVTFDLMRERIERSFGSLQ